VGVYHWVATYTPDSSGNTVGTNHNTSCTDSKEDVTVIQIGTKTVTTPTGLNGSVPGTTTFNSSVQDTVVVTAAASGGPLVTGTVTFFVCNPSQVSGGTCATGGTQVSVATLTPTAGANPPSSTATSGSVTTNATGLWCFRAFFTPATSAYTGSSEASAGECFTVKDTTTASSNQTWVPNDTATVSSNNGAPLNGTLTVELHHSVDCSGSAVQTYSTTATGTSTSVSLTTTNSTFVVTTSDSVSWLVTFTSSDPNVAPSSHCEISSVTISN
jgi:hypothetical protein